MPPRVVITGLGSVSGLGIGAAAMWEAVCNGRSALATICAFDPAGFDVRIGSEVREFKVNDYVPKSYRKATKVMARDISLAVAAADRAVRDANLMTPGIDPEQPRSYPGNRTGCHIGAGLIAAEINELGDAAHQSVGEDGEFDLHKWGSEGMTHLTPLWLLKYLPNMLACHVTIIHDAQGPSNTITCSEASSGLSIGESMRVIQRGNADMCFCGGAESKINPMTFYRQYLTGHLTKTGNDRPAAAVRPFDQTADGSVPGEGGSILVLESRETADKRGARVYAQLVGFGASHTIHPEGGGLVPDPAGKGIAAAIKSALRDAHLTPADIDLIIPFGSAIPAFDQAEAAAMKSVFGDRLADIPLWSSAPYVGNIGAGNGGMNAAVAAMALAEQTIPARLNCDTPVDGLNAKSAAAAKADLRHVLVFTSSLGGQNVALILSRA
ncbi:MAG: beta-ketoacyl-[acyl-carrier-protein] synthase family protein [Planctomycetes bacterium]|nr:beta-ketoacyl-[acyl-carrier-protein] synthase family protein [Planctomycetota bacterium]